MWLLCCFSLLMTTPFVLVAMSNYISIVASDMGISTLWQPYLMQGCYKIENTMDSRKNLKTNVFMIASVYERSVASIF